MEDTRHFDYACYYCLEIFPKELIKVYVDNRQTALCPCCSIDSVVTFINMKELKKLNKKYFS